MVRIIGHRGARGLYPENSLFGFINVLKSGIEIIELDIVLCRLPTAFSINESVSL